MNSKIDHITVCICTYKRPKMLARLLEKINDQITGNKFVYSVVVVDNDSLQSAKEVVELFKKNSSIHIDYFNEIETNFALVRNTAIKNAKGNYIAFIDDDEFPIDGWLFEHFNTINNFNAAGSLGPVLPYFAEQPPKWIIKGKICERKRFPTGTILSWNNTRTGNVLFNKDIISDNTAYFDIKFGKIGGEDVDFFRRMINKGYQFVSCDEAIAFEENPKERLKLKYFLKRAFLRGYISYNYFKNEMTLQLQIRMFIKSFIALLIYIMLLPFLIIFSFHNFIKYLIKSIDHFSKLLSILGFIKDKKRNF